MTAVVAVTGGIAAGKTVLSDYCAERHGIDVIDTDRVTHELLASDDLVHTRIRERFGPEVFLDNGSISRKALREVVFSQPQMKSYLEQIMHPRIREHVHDFVIKSRSTYVMVVVPLLVETQSQSRYDRIIVVDSPINDRYKRCEARGLRPDMIQAILQSQASKWDRLAIADDIVYNRRGLDFFYQQIDKLICHYRRLFS